MGPTGETAQPAALGEALRVLRDRVDRDGPDAADVGGLQTPQDCIAKQPSADCPCPSCQRVENRTSAQDDPGRQPFATGRHVDASGPRRIIPRTLMTTPTSPG